MKKYLHNCFEQGISSENIYSNLDKNKQQIWTPKHNNYA